MDISQVFCMMMMLLRVMKIKTFSVGQNDDPSGPNIDLAPSSLQEKKMEAEKRSMGMMDYNGDLRKGGRGGGSGGGVIYRPPGSKEAPPGDVGQYYDKVMPHLHLVNLLSLMSFSRLDNIMSFMAIYFLL